MGWFERLTAIISSAGMALMSFSMIFNQQNLKSVGNLFNNVLLQFGMGVDATSASLMFGADASMTFGTALKTVIGPMLAVIAILSALAFAIKKVYEEIHKDEIELKKLNKELENSKKAAEEASSAYEQLKSSLDSLKDAHDTLAGLTEGTLE